MRKNWLLGFFLALVLVGASACGGTDEDGGDTSNGAQQQQEEKQADPSAPQADLEGIPEVVAEVNGEEIPREEFVQAYEAQFQQAAMQSQTSGQEVDQDQLKKQVADSLVSTELFVQEAAERDISASDQEVDQRLKQLAAQNGLESVDAFVAALEEQGMDREEIDSQVRTQVLIERLIESEAGDVSASKQEVRAMYDELVAQQEQAGEQAGQEMPPFAEVRPQLEEQVESEKKSEVAQSLLQELREDADVVVNL
ncbi:MAG TPA: SurA N-terminal domain-containing protein [Nocardioidaceae bacterium]|nr:SurA N-terminal domain-containing protein [Nocardioidaceae bacterium]